MTGLMTGKTVLVTGAGSGIGAATARLMAEHGARVALGYHRDASGAEAVLAALPGSGHLVLPVVIDEAESLVAAAAWLDTEFGHLDCLVNSAGSSKRVPHGDLDALTDEFFDQITRINLRGPFATIRAMLQLLRKAPDGASIVNIGSLAAHTGVGSNIAYVASKGGISAMSKSLARVLGPQIRVLTVSPAGVETDFLKGRDPAVSLRNAETAPLKKQTFPESIAATVLACAALMPSATGIDVIADEGRHLVGWPL